MLSFYRQHCAKRMQRYSSARGDFEVFRPAEATRCTDGADIRLVCRLIHAKYHPNRCRGGMLAPEVKILTSFFYQISKYKRASLAHPVRDFYEIFMVCAPGSRIEIKGDSLKRFWSYGGFKLRRSSNPRIICAP